MDYAQSLGYPPPRAVALAYKGRRRAKSISNTDSEASALPEYVEKCFVFTTVNGTELKISAGDNYYSSENLWRNSKGQLTAGQNTTGKPYRKRKRPPSRTWDEDWLFAASPDAPGDDDSQFSGKWLLFVAWHRVDEAWEAISKAVKSGHLGPYAKVSTAAANATGTDSHVICVYCPDHRDRDDVMRVRERLRSMGFERKIPFKPDEMTIRGENGSLFSA